MYTRGSQCVAVSKTHRELLTLSRLTAAATLDVGVVVVVVVAVGDDGGGRGTVIGRFIGVISAVTFVVAEARRLTDAANAATSCRSCDMSALECWVGRTGVRMSSGSAAWAPVTHEDTITDATHSGIVTLSI